MGKKQGGQVIVNIDVKSTSYNIVWFIPFLHLPVLPTASQLQTAQQPSSVSYQLYI